MATDTKWLFLLNVVEFQGRKVHVKGVLIDCSNSSNGVTLQVGPLTTSVPPFNRLPVDLPLKAAHVRITGVSPDNIGVTFYPVTRETVAGTGRNIYGVATNVG